ncbi:MAG: hypothetical protein ACLT78_12080 [Escherichia coli]
MPPREPIISTTVNGRGCTLFGLGALFAGRYGGAPALQFFPWPDVDAGRVKLAQMISTLMPECCASG